MSTRDRWLSGGRPLLAAALATALFAASLAKRAGAQGPSPAPEGAAPAPALPPLPPVPRLQLAPPGAGGSSAGKEGPPWTSYWRDARVPGEWRYSTDADLRLEIPTAQLNLGRLSLSAQLETVPGRERDCEPDCRGPQWSSTLRLRFDTGDVGPLRETGPQLQLGGTPPRGKAQGRGFFGAGFGGKF